MFYLEIIECERNEYPHSFLWCRCFSCVEDREFEAWIESEDCALAPRREVFKRDGYRHPYQKTSKVRGRVKMVPGNSGKAMSGKLAHKRMRRAHKLAIRNGEYFNASVAMV